MAARANAKTPQRYVLSRIEPGREVDLWHTADLDAALRKRDENEATKFPRELHRVTDSDDAERGDADWCSECSAHGTFGDVCDLCQQGIEAEEAASA
jgi:hypothetical protein